MIKSELFICNCNSVGHNFIIQLDEYEDNFELVLSVHLNNYLTFWKRIYVAIRYIFGYTASDYGHYDCVLIKRDDVSRLQNLLKEFQEKNK